MTAPPRPRGRLVRGVGSALATLVVAARGAIAIALALKVSYTFLQLVGVARLDRGVAFKFVLFLVSLGVLLAAALLPYARIWRLSRSTAPESAAVRRSWARTALVALAVTLAIGLSTLVLGPPAALLVLLAVPYGKILRRWKSRGRTGPATQPVEEDPRAARPPIWIPRLSRVIGVELALALAVLELTNPLFIRYHPTRFWETHPRLANGNGLRGPAATYEKPPGVFRIACIGDSVTYGYGTERDEDTYPIALGRMLAERSPLRPIEVLNAGVVGYSSYQGLVFLRDEITRYHPDLVLAYFGLHEMLMPEVTTLADYQAMMPSPFERTLLHSGTVQLWVLGHWVHQRGYVRSFGESERIESILQHNFQFNLSEMERIGEREPDRFPLYWTIPIDWKDGQLRRVWPLDAWREDRLIDAYPRFAAQPGDPGHLYIDEVHFSVEGNRVMAEALADALVERGLVPVNQHVDGLASK